MVALSASAASQDGARLGAIALDVAERCAAESIDLLLGGSGAWPDVLPSGVGRMRSFRALHESIVRATGQR